MSQMAEGFLLGVISVASMASGMFFLKFWKRTRDSLFLAFGLAFLIEGFNRIGLLFVSKPSEASAVYYVVRMLAFLLILGAIVKKNARRN